MRLAGVNHIKPSVATFSPLAYAGVRRDASLAETITPEPRNSGSETAASNLEAAFFLIGASFFFAVTAALVKASFEHGIGSFQLVLLRAVIGLVILAPLLWHGGIVPWRSNHLDLHMTRSLSGGIAVTIGFFAFTVIPLATATAMNFTMPLFVTILSVLILKEAVGWRRWSATLVGFLGVVVMIQPGTEGFDPIALIVLVQAICIALSVTVVKRFPVKESQLSMMFFTFISSGLIALVPAINEWVWPDWTQSGLILAVALAGIAAQAMVLRAYRKGQASYVAPLSYSRLIFAGALGMIFFAEYPDAATWIGAGVIVLSGIYTARRAEARRRA
ncbi:MAG: hypothetical protein CMM46_05570 [Rhodospirillaceae bacterium]|nr:hypothetical protein [Rhodospirillaceae bacterium]